MNQPNVSRKHSTHERSALQRVSTKCGSILLGVYVAFAGHVALAGPEGGQVVSGTGTITQPGANTTLITQGSHRLGLEWQTFNVGEAETVRFDQPTTEAVALNHIFDQNPSQILGAIDANGQVFLVNPNGVIFGESARVDVGALLASSLNISMEDFMVGNYDFDALGGEAGLVVNRGLITAATGGHVTLLGGAVANEGLIIADLGQVNLGAGSRASLDFDGDGLLFFEIDDAVLSNVAELDSAVSNSGEISANGGEVLLTARTAQDIFANVVNNEGVIRAARIDDSGGAIRLLGDGGNVLSSGTLDASGQGGAGGTVQVLGDQVGLFGDAVVNVSGDTDGGLAQIGGSFQGSDPDVSNANRTYVSSGSQVTADAGAAGDGGEVIVWADEITRFYGEISARGGAEAGDGGFVEVSGKETLIYRGQVDASASNGGAGTLLLDPENIEIVGGVTAQAQDGTVTDDGATAFDDDNGVAYTISEDAIESSNFNIILEAQNSITVSGIFDNTEASELDGVVLIQSDNNLVMRTRNATGEGSVGIDLTGSTHTDALTFQTQGIGTITMTAGIDGVDAGGDLGTASVVAGNLTTAGGLVALTAEGGVTANGVSTAGADDSPGGSVSLTANGGALVVTSVTTDGGADTDDSGGENAGTVTLAGNTVSVGAISALGTSPQTTTSLAAGNGGLTQITAQAGITLNGNINTSGGAADTPGTDGNIVLLAGQGGAGSANTVSTGVVITGGTVSLTGGAGADTFDLDADLLGNVAGLGGTDAFNVTVAQTGGIDGGDDADTITLTSGVTVGGTLTGGGGGTNDDTLAVTGGTGPNAWAVTAPDQGDLDGQAFTDIENLTGNGNVDNFTIGAAGTLAGSINGSGGADTLNVSAPAAVTVNLENSSATPLNGGAAAGFASIESFTGNGTTDVLVGPNGGATFATTAANTGTVAGVSFIDFANLTGGTGTDTFELQHNVTGTVDGGDNADTVRLTDGVTVGTLTGGAGAGAGTDGDILESVDVGNTANTWVVDNPDEGTLNAQAFTEFENLTGNAEADGFTFTAALTGTADGAAGDDTFAVNDGGSAGTFQGGEGGETVVGDTLTYAGSTGPVTISVANLVEMEIVTGSGSANDTLEGTGAGDTFTTTDVDEGTVNADLAYSSFENLSGLGGADTFNLADNVTGTVDGGDNADTVRLTDGVTVGTLTGGAGAGAGTDGDILESVDVGNTANIWVVDNPDEGTLNAQAFTEFENLTGNAEADGFTFTAALTGTADGAAGDDTFAVNDGGSAGTFQGGEGGETVVGDTLTYAGSTGPVTISVANLVEMEIVTGSGSANDTLEGTGAGDTFTTTDVDEGTVNADLAYSSFENLSGLGGTDTFNLADNVTGTVDGGDNADTVRLTDGVTVGTLTGGAGAGAGTDGDILESVDVGNTANTWVVDNPDEGTLNAQAFTEFENLTGNAEADGFTFTAALTGTADGAAGDDTFAVNDGGSAGTFQGGEGGETVVGDTLTYAGSTGPVTISVANLVEMEIVTGSGSANDTLEGTGAGDTFTTTDVDEGTVNADLAYSSFENLSGLGGTDTFNLADNVTGTVDGGDNADTVRLTDGVTVGTLTGGAGAGAGTDGDILESVDVGNTANTWVVDNPDEGTLNAQAFTEFENLTGNAEADGFTFTAALTGTADGAAGDDTFAVNDGGSAGTFQGGEGGETVVGDTLTYAGSTGPVTISVANLVEMEIVTGSGSANDTLEGTGAGDTFTTTDVDEGTVNADLAYSSFENLSGLGGTDTFNLADNVTGTVDGGDNADTVRLTDGVTVGTLTGGAGAGAGTDGDILESVDVGNTANIWVVDNPDEGTLNAQAFTEFENLTGNAEVDTFDLDADLTGTAAGGAGDDIFNLAANVSATVAGDGDSDEIVADPATATDFDVNSADGGQVTNGAGTVNFSSIETLTGSAQDDTFNLDGGTAAGNLTFVGNAGTDSANVAADSTIVGTLALTGIESVTGGSTLTAAALDIDGASGGIGPLSTDVGTLLVTNSGGMLNVSEADALTILGLDMGGGDIFVETGGSLTQSGDIVSIGAQIELVTLDGDLVVGLLNAGPPNGMGGAVTLTAGDTGTGSILNGNGAAENIQGATATLTAAAGEIGALGDPIKIAVFAPQTDEATIFLTALGNAYIDATTGATFDDTNVLGITIEDTGIRRDQTAATSAATLRDLTAIDWAGLDPNVTLIDCLEPCIRLPEDQSEDGGFAQLRDATKLLLIRTTDGWKLIPVFEGETVAAN